MCRTTFLYILCLQDWFDRKECCMSGGRCQGGQTASGAPRYRLCCVRAKTQLWKCSPLCTGCRWLGLEIIRSDSFDTFQVQNIWLALFLFFWLLFGVSKTLVGEWCQGTQAKDRACLFAPRVVVHGFWGRC